MTIRGTADAIASYICSDIAAVRDSRYHYGHAGSASPFNGHLYSLIGIGRLTDTNETKNIEKSIAKKVGVSL